MGKTTDTLLDRMVKVIVDEVAPEQVILFGSRARADAPADSDVDLVVVEAEPFGAGRDRRAEAARLWRALADAAVFADEIYGFHVQQAAEKLPKAWLALLGETYPTTHDLARLLAMLRPCQVGATRFNDLVEYTPFAVQFRYAPGDLSASPLDRDTAIGRVEVLLTKRFGGSSTI